MNQDQADSRWKRVRGWLLSRNVIRVCWVMNVAVLLGTTVWILRDGKFAEGVVAFKRHIAAYGNEESALTVVPPLLWPRVDALWFVFITAVISSAGIFTGLVAGAGIHRGVRAWLVVMLLLAGWLTLVTTWPQLVWQGQVWRVAGAIPEFNQLSEKLLANWPDNDGDIDPLGPFMAYPIGKPRTLMLIKNPHVPGTDLTISLIERNTEETLLYQLAGNEEGLWVVKEQADEPQAFFSGLDGEYMPVHFRRLKPGWFLVRYIYAPTVMPESRQAR